MGRIRVNAGARVFDARPGETLFKALRSHGIAVPAVCGGRGLCGRCRLKDPATIEFEAGREFRFSPLSLHLICDHGFYNGRGSRFCVEPADVHRLLLGEGG